MVQMEEIVIKILKDAPHGLTPEEIKSKIASLAVTSVNSPTYEVLGNLGFWKRPNTDSLKVAITLSALLRDRVAEPDHSGKVALTDKGLELAESMTAVHNGLNHSEGQLLVR